MVDETSSIVKVPECQEDAAITAGWQAAEDGLYASLMSDVQVYEGVVRLIGALVGHLRATVFDLAGLVAAAAQGPDLIAEVAPDAPAPWILAGAAVKAACAMRHRELHADAERRSRLAAIDAARQAGEPWAWMDGPAALGVPVPTVLCIHVATGAAVSSSTDIDIDTGGVLFAIRPRRVDLSTGALHAPPSSLGADREASSAEERDRHLAEVRTLVEHLDSQDHLV